MSTPRGRLGAFGATAALFVLWGLRRRRKKKDAARRKKKAAEEEETKKAGMTEEELAAWEKEAAEKKEKALVRRMAKSTMWGIFLPSTKNLMDMKSMNEGGVCVL